MAIILKANKANLFVSSLLFVFWYHSPNFLDTPRMMHGYQNNAIPLQGRAIPQGFMKLRISELITIGS
jgi:hypothetical protein